MAVAHYHIQVKAQKPLSMLLTFHLDIVTMFIFVKLPYVSVSVNLYLHTCTYCAVRNIFFWKYIYNYLFSFTLFEASFVNSMLSLETIISTIFS